MAFEPDEETRQALCDYLDKVDAQFLLFDAVEEQDASGYTIYEGEIWCDRNNDVADGEVLYTYPIVKGPDENGVVTVFNGARILLVKSRDRLPL